MSGSPIKTSRGESGRVPEERIIDVIFGTTRPARRRRIGVAVIAAFGLHGVLGLLALHVEPSLESWSAELAMRVHAELGREEIVELPPSPPPEEPSKVEPPEPQPEPPLREKAVARAARPQPPESGPPPPAQAGNVLTQEPDPTQPADFTGNTFVTGDATAYAGGVTTARGTNPNAVHTREVDSEAPPRGPDRSSPVRLPDHEWRCPWPAEADDEQIDEQTAVIRVVVRPNGTVESASIVNDPGHGFGAAALACARSARFSPAKDRSGQPIRAQSPPIRVRFTR